MCVKVKVPSFVALSVGSVFESFPAPFPAGGSVPLCLVDRRHPRTQRDGSSPEGEAGWPARVRFDPV